MVYYKSGSERTYQVFVNIVVAIVAVSAIFPLIYVVGISLTSQQELIEKNYFLIWPDKPTLFAYERIFATDVVWRSLLVSVLRSTIGPLVSLAFTLVGAYVLSRRTLPGRKFFLLFILATILFNGGLIPSYLVVRNLGLINTFWAYIVPGMVDSFNLLVIKVFIENLPQSLMESAEIDGANHSQLLVRIVAPLTKPAMAAIGMFSVVAHWNSWFDALIWINNKALWPLQLILRNLLIGTSFTSDQMNLGIMMANRISVESMKMATVVVGVLPIIIIYPFFQRYFIHGVYMGAVKE